VHRSKSGPLKSGQGQMQKWPIEAITSALDQLADIRIWPRHLGSLHNRRGMARLSYPRRCRQYAPLTPPSAQTILLSGPTLKQTEGGWIFLSRRGLGRGAAASRPGRTEYRPRKAGIFFHPTTTLRDLMRNAHDLRLTADRQKLRPLHNNMTRQAIALGWMPRLRVTQTSEEGYGQIYVGSVNWLLMVATLALTIIFRKSDNLAAAYGIAVSLTMLLTSVLLFIAMREIWGWSPVKAGAIALVFLVVDCGFFTSNLTKVLEGGYVPLLLAVAVYGVMWIWHRGTSAVRARVMADEVPLKQFVEIIGSHDVARVPGSAVFLTRADSETPPVLVWHVRKNRSLHEYVLILKLVVTSSPRTKPSERLQIERIADKLWRIEARHGFMERTNVLAVLDDCRTKGVEMDRDDVTFYVGHETIIPREGRRGIPRWQEAVFAAMARNSVRITDVLKLPHNQVVEIGREVAI
jgi:hypothetical protein